MSSRLSLADGVVIELVGQDLIALVPESSAVKLTGAAAHIVRAILSGDKVEGDGVVVEDLIRSGVVSAGPGVSRRDAVKLGVVATGAGVATLALPSVAAASSAVLTGVWRWVYDPILTGLSSPPWIRIFDVILPDSFVDPGSDPSVLTALGAQFDWKQSVDQDENLLRPTDQGKVVFYNDPDPDSDKSGEKEDPLTGPITGSFTWGGVTYQVTFTQEEDVEPESPGPTQVTGNFDTFSDSGITDIEIFVPLSEGDFTNAGSPTAMQVAGLTDPVPFVRFDTEGGRAGFWSRVEGVGDTYAPGEITGTFTWDGEEFEAKLQFDPGAD